jgi:hypothetical protein
LLAALAADVPMPPYNLIFCSSVIPVGEENVFPLVVIAGLDNACEDWDTIPALVEA